MTKYVVAVTVAVAVVIVVLNAPKRVTLVSEEISWQLRDHLSTEEISWESY